MKSRRPGLFLPGEVIDGEFVLSEAREIEDDELIPIFAAEAMELVPLIRAIRQNTGYEQSHVYRLSSDFRRVRLEVAVEDFDGREYREPERCGIVPETTRAFLRGYSMSRSRPVDED